MRIGVSLPVREMTDDLGAIRAFAVAAEELGFTHLRVPEQIMRPESGYLHEPLMMLSYIAACTRTIELVPSVIILPARQTVLFAKQAAQLDVLSGGRVRLGIGIGGSEPEYAAQGIDFRTRGARCTEQMQLLKQLWTESPTSFSGRFHEFADNGLDPLPVQRPIPLWIGGRSVPSAPVVERIGTLADGWFVLCSPEDFDGVHGSISSAARHAGRDPATIGTEAGIAVVGPREAEWQDRVLGWQRKGLTHLCMRTLGGGLAIDQHVPVLERTAEALRSLVP